MRRPPQATRPAKPMLAAEWSIGGPGRSGGFEYWRSGTRLPYAALKRAKTGRSHCRRRGRQLLDSQEEASSFSVRSSARCEPDQEIHLGRSSTTSGLQVGSRRRSLDAARRTSPYQVHADLLVVAAKRGSRFPNAAGVACVIARRRLHGRPPISPETPPLHQRLRKTPEPFRSKSAKPSRRIRHGKTVSLATVRVCRAFLQRYGSSLPRRGPVAQILRNLAKLCICRHDYYSFPGAVVQCEGTVGWRHASRTSDSSARRNYGIRILEAGVTQRAPDGGPC